MSTIQSIDEESLTEVGQDGTQEQTPPCPETSPLEMKDSIMNSKLLYAITVAISFLGSLAMAGSAVAATEPLTRAQVSAELAAAAVNGTLQRTDYDFNTMPAASASTTPRSQVIAELGDAKARRKALVGPQANRLYNPFGTEILGPSIVTRAEVKAEVLQAAAAGTLQRTDYDDATLVARRANAHIASARFGQRVKAGFARPQG